MSVIRRLILAFLIFTGGPALAIQPPPFAWARVVGAAGQDYGRGFAVDTNGNSYIAGSFDGTATFGSTNITSAGGNNRPDIYLAKYDPAGQLVWVRRAGGNGTDTANALALDPQGNIVIGGQSDSVPISFGTTNVTASSQKIVFAKYDSNGNVLWVRVSLSQELFPPHSGNATGAACDSAGNIYFTGVFTGKANFGGTPNTFPPPTGGHVVTNSGGDAKTFIVKYSPAGSALWARQTTGSNLSESRGIAVAPSGDVYVVGRFNATTTFGAITLTSSNASYDTDIYLAKLDAAGNFLWVQEMQSNDTDHGQAVAVDSQGAPHVLGSYFGNYLYLGGTVLTNGFTRANGFVAKYNSAGVLQWTNQFDRLSVGEVLIQGGAAIDPNGNLLVTGGFGQVATFDTVTLTNTGGQSFFVALIENGTTVWAKRAGGAYGDSGTGVGVDRAGHIYVAGTIGNEPAGITLQFDSIILTNINVRDIFVARIDGSAPESGPPMSFSISGGNLVLTWPLANADFRVESTAVLGVPFGPATEPRVTNTSAGTISVTINPSGPQKFYRLARP